MTKTMCPLIARSLILTQGRGKDRQNEKKIVLEWFACMLVIHQNDALLRNMATVKHCHHFHHLYLYTFKGEAGSEKVYGLYACENDDNYRWPLSKYIVHGSKNGLF